MTAYKKIIQQHLVPSFFLFLATVVFIFLLDSFYLNRSLFFFTGVGFFIASLGCLGWFSVVKLNSHLRVSFLIILLIIISFLFYRLSAPKVAEDINFTGQILYGIIKKNSPKRYHQEAIINFSNKVDDLKKNKGLHSGLVYLDLNREVIVGDQFSFKAKVKRIDPKKDNSFLQIFLWRQGLDYLLYLEKDSWQKLSQASSSLSFFRKNIKKNLDQFFSPGTSSFLKALYLGDKNYLSKEIILNFKRAGVLHSLAASGLHVGIIAFLPLLIFNFLRIKKRYALGIVSGLIFFYLCLAGFPVSLQRACLMFFLYACQSLFFLEKNIFNTFFLTALIILVLYPYQLFNLGFQLSFGATYGILLFFDFYKKAFYFLPKGIKESFSLTLAAQVFVFPLILFSLQEINLVGFISNLLVIPLVAVILIFSLGTNILSLFYLKGAQIWGKLTDFIFEVLQALTNFFANWLGHFSLGESSLVLLFFFFLFLVPTFPFKNRKWLFVPVFASFTLAWFFLSSHYIRQEVKNKKFFKDNKISLQEEGEIITVSGDLNSFPLANQLVNYLEQKGAAEIRLKITNFNYKNIMNYTYLIKKSLISKCLLPSNFRVTPYLEKFFQVVEADNVKLIFY